MPSEVIMTNRNNETRIDSGSRTKALLELSVERDHQRMVHLLAGYEFPWDFHRALELGLLRTFASPSVSGLLDATGEFRERGQKRYDDTGLLVAEFTKNGYDSPRGAMAIQRMNELHAQFKIPNDDFLFVLSTFVLDPIDWTSQYGWRAMSPRECNALFLFWKNVAQRMGLTDIPDGLNELREFSVEYVRREVQFDNRNRRVADATLDVIRKWLPWGTRWLVVPTVNALIDPPMREAFGFARPWMPVRIMVTSLLKFRACAVSVLPKRSAPSFFCDAPTHTYRSNGCEIQRIGPANRHESMEDAGGDH